MNLEDSKSISGAQWFSAGVFASLFAFSTLLKISYSWAKKKSPKTLPGVKGYPVLGCLPYLKKYPNRSFKQWSLEKYGPVMPVRLVHDTVVILNNYEAVKQAFITNSLATAGRSESFLFGQLQGNNGITFIDYSQLFAEHKKFGLKYFESFTVQGWERLINEENDFLTKELSLLENKPTDIRMGLFNSCANVLSKIILGKRFEHGSKELLLMYDSFENILGTDGELLALIELVPLLRHLPTFSTANQRFVKRGKKAMEFITSIIEKRKKEGVGSNIPSSFIDCYLQKQDRKNPSDQCDYSEGQLVAYVRDLLGAGIKNSYITIYWLVLYCLHHPRYHEMLVTEIDNVLKKQPASHQSKQRMPFTCAFIEEVYRHATPLPKTLAHKTHSEIEVMNCVIPAGTKIVGNLWGVHHDPETWPNPELFNPFRHIDEEGSFVSSRKVIPFSLGPRSCFGEKLGKLIVHVTFVKLLQTFEVSGANHLPPLSEGDEGVTFDPYPFKIILNKRC